MTTHTTSPPELPKKYAPAEHEHRISQRWADANAFHPDPAAVTSGQRTPYSILIPPPNVTARLHLGHALNNALQDALIRAHRMMGHETLWMPGTDHAGIATQTVVDKRLKEAGQPALADYKKQEATTPNTGRPAFIEKVQDWSTQYRKEITDQLKEIGCSCDWQRERFTMDDQCARAVQEAFFRLFQDNLIYRGKRLVNWDPVTQTALADDEVETHDVNSFFWYMKYPLCSKDGTETGQHLTVATTRPETYFGDTAVAVNPNDPERKHLIGTHAKLPFVNRVVPIIGDDHVVMPDPESSDAKARYASGFLKVTPAHDPNDWDIGQRHNLPIINVMAPDASISDKHGWTDIGDAQQFIGLSREDARAAVEQAFKDTGLLADKKPHTHAVGHSYRSHAEIEPYLSDQWYCKVSDDRLVGNAQRALAKDQRTTETYPPTSPNDQTPDHTLRFFPERYAKTYENWHDNLRDWCISRQLWWGHQIPVWHAVIESTPTHPGVAGTAGSIGLDHIIRNENPDIAIQVAAEDGTPLDREAVLEIHHDPDKDTAKYHVFLCFRNDQVKSIPYYEENGFQRDPDVLDTWFSSALWPLSTMGWPDNTPLLDAYNPSNVLCTGRDIVTLWVSRMVMFNRYFTTDEKGSPGNTPFHHTYIHPIIQDGFGQRMSKSLGNGVDPLDIVHSHGADAMRFVLAKLATATQDVRISVDLVCPHTDQTFEPEYITSPQGRQVAAPTQKCPTDPAKAMVTAFGVASGQATPSDTQPLARNTSSKFDEGRNFVTKLFNATKFALSKLPSETSTDTIDSATLTLTDKWMLSRLAATTGAAEHALANYAFADYANAMYDLLWRDVCDWYLEYVKPTVETNATQQAVLRAALDTVLRLLHPICPFVTELLFEHLQTTAAPTIPGVTLDQASDAHLLCLTPWPTFDPALINPTAESEFNELRRFTEAVRNVRATNNIGFRTQIDIHAPAEITTQITNGAGLVETLTNAKAVITQDPTNAEASANGGGGEGGVPFNHDAHACLVAGFESDIDADKLKTQLTEQLTKLEKDIAGLEKRLSNPGYTDKAPEHLVNQTRDQLAQKQTERDAAQSRLDQLA